MIIYKDRLSGDEMFSDAYKVRDMEDGFIVSVQGQMASQKSDALSDNLFGGNASAEDGGGEEYDATNAKTGIDIVMAQDLQDQSEFFPTKKAVSSYLRSWSKKMLTVFKDDKEKTDCFKKDCVAKMKSFCDLWNSSDASVYSGPNFDLGDPVSSILIGIWTTDGMSMTLYAIKYGLEEEKQ